MPDVEVRVSLVGGSMLTRDLFAHMLHEAGIVVIAEQSPIETGDLALVIADDESPERLLHEIAHRRAVVIADVDPEDEQVAELVLEGADAIVGLQATVSELSQVVRTVAGGGSVIAPRPARRLAELARSNRSIATSQRPSLTRREVDILQSIERGDSVKQTAASLGISAKTVENLQSRLFRKLEVRNRAQAFARAHALGLLTPKDEEPR